MNLKHWAAGPLVGLAFGWMLTLMAPVAIKLLGALMMLGALVLLVVRLLSQQHNHKQDRGKGAGSA